ncbi:MAG: menaquinone biosynthesis protein [Planctomycetes bacterium]|nr:menaquinone biosynthesis protein [Planctomycetota bacterium]
MTKNLESIAEAATLRVGGIDYLNALPLTDYLPLTEDPPLVVTNLAPSALARGLRSGELDLALVPVVEYLAVESYKIIPDICISSYGAVESIRFYHRKPLSEVRRVGIDSSSRTSAMLTRVLFRLRWNSSPEFFDLSPRAIEAFLDEQSEEGRTDSGDKVEVPHDLDAVLLIGDSALWRQAPLGWRQIDLGNEWTRWTGLPFVYAFWVWRGDRPVPAGLIDRFQRGKEIGVTRIDEIVRRWCDAHGGNETLARDYLRRVIQYDFGEVQRKGLLEFFGLLNKVGVLSEAPQQLRSVESFS